MHGFRVGERVLWHWAPLRGYGRTYLVNAVVIRIAPRRVQIETRDGRHWVRRDKLSKRGG